MPCSHADPADLDAPGMRFLPMAEEHLPQVLGIERRSFATPWRPEHFRFELTENPWAETWVVERGGDILAYLAAWRLGEEYKINNVAVREDQRRRGVARFLLERALWGARRAGCTRATLEVRASNVAAQRLYARLGFSVSGRRKNYYQSEHEDAILMDADLAAAPTRDESC